MKISLAIFVVTLITQGPAEQLYNSTNHAKELAKSIPPEIQHLFSDSSTSKASLSEQKNELNANPSSVEDSKRTESKVKKGSTINPFVAASEGSGGIKTKVAFTEGGIFLTSSHHVENSTMSVNKTFVNLINQTTQPVTAGSEEKHSLKRLPNSSDSNSSVNERPMSLDLLLLDDGGTHKNSSTVVARKGVGTPPPEPEIISSTENSNGSELNSTNVCECCTNSSKLENCTCCVLTSVKPVSEQPVVQTTPHNNIIANETYQKHDNSTDNSTSNVKTTTGSPQSVPIDNNSTTNSSNSTKAPLNRKPTATAGHEDESSSDLQNSLVIPIVSIILAVPLVVVLCMFLYKKSVEFWERRHYRRMDFLIDGMYNE